MSWRRHPIARAGLPLLMLLAAGAGMAADRQAEFDAAFDATFERYQLPGLAVGIVVGGEVVFRRTAGELEAGSGKAVTPRSLFKIASLSKAMTTALLARLAARGRLDWNDPVRRHLPQFRMHDPWVGEHMQVRDLLIHNSGLGKGAGDLMLWPEPNRFTRADVIAGLAHLVPSHGFRSHYAYDNILYIVAGEVAAAAGGASYEELMEREVFAPLGLSRCRAGGFAREAVGEVAQPHMRKDGRNVVIRADGDTIPTLTSAAAGGIRCSLDDMLQWLRAWLDEDVAPDWLPAAQREALWTPHMPMPLSARQRDWERAHFHAYGYGWRLSDFHGLLKVSHTGTLAGMYALLVLLPERDAGFVLLTNGHGDAARTVLGQVLAEQLAGVASPADVAGYAARLEAAPRSADAPAMPDVSARAAVAPSMLADGLGIWSDPWFGEVAICPQDGQVRFVAAKSPRLAGTVMRLDQRLLVDWDADSVDAMPWLHFPGPGADGVLRLSHVDPDADFSYDYADLAFTRSGPCPAPAR